MISLCWYAFSNIWGVGRFCWGILTYVAEKLVQDMSCEAKKPAVACHAGLQQVHHRSWLSAAFWDLQREWLANCF